MKCYRLKRRLNKLSEVKFGSQESGLNRIGVAVPNTNKNAVEGSNPVYNEEKKIPDFDRSRYVFEHTFKDIILGIFFFVYTVFIVETPTLLVLKTIQNLTMALKMKDTDKVNHI